MSCEGGNGRVKLVSDFLHRLHAGGVRLHILSHGFEHEIIGALKWLGVAQLFEGVCSRLLSWRLPARWLLRLAQLTTAPAVSPCSRRFWTFACQYFTI